MTAENKTIEIRNPYDFANPVREQNLFFGRKQEIKDVEYYIDQAEMSSYPINLAMIGERASGKTSFLNLIELNVINKSMVSVRIDLNEMDASSHIAFFYKVFDSIFSAVLKYKGDDENDIEIFGGESGKTYDTYLDITSTFEIPTDKEFCPFIFPIIYAKQMSKGNLNLPIPDHIIINDLKKIHDEVGKTIVVLFDECDVLAKNSPLLQMIRNVFMNLQGYMLIFSGTPNLFPVMDEVFSPIIRQFKKIEVKPFESPKETESCILDPLKLNNLEEYWDENHPFELFDIHSLTGGRPYEIQLVCHFMFRRIQFGQAKKMKLNVDLLDNVLKELREGVEIEANSVITAIKSLNRHQLKQLGKVSFKGTINQLWFGLNLTNDQEISKDEIKTLIEEFKELEIIDINKEGVVEFSGDEFDKIYSKYYSKQQKVSLPFDVHPIIMLQYNLMNLVFKHKEKKVFDMFFYSSREFFITSKNEIQNKIDYFEELVANLSPETVFCENNTIFPDLYQLMREAEINGISSIQLIAIFVHSNDLFYFNILSSTVASDKELTNMLKSLSEIKEKALIFDGDMHILHFELPVWNSDEILECVCECDSQSFKNECSIYEINKMFNFYMESDREKAYSCASIAHKIHSLTSRNANNTGYIFLVNNNFDEAEDLFKKAIKTWPDADDSLPRYNLGLVSLIQGKHDHAKSIICEAYDIVTSIVETEELCSALLVPRLVDGKIELEELQSEPLLSSVIKDAINIVDEIMLAATPGTT